jgi:hypothetical protein
MGRKSIKKPRIKKYMKIISIDPHQSNSRRTFGETISFTLKLKHAKKHPAKLLKKIFQGLLDRLVLSELYFRGF